MSTFALAFGLLSLIPFKGVHADTSLLATPALPTLFEETAASEADSSEAEALAADSFDLLPSSISQWTRLESSFEPGPEAAELSLLPQVRRSLAPPLFDFDHFQAGIIGGLANFGPSFKANSNYLFGVEAHLGMPALPLDHWGLWGQAFISYIHRDLPFFYTRQAENWYGGAVGGDFTFKLSDIAYFRPQAGLFYADFNKVNGVQSGIGGILGGQIGLFWIKRDNRAIFTINPQFTSNGKDWMVLTTIGLDVIF